MQCVRAKVARRNAILGLERRDEVNVPRQRRADSITPRGAARLLQPARSEVVTAALPHGTCHGWRNRSETPADARCRLDMGGAEALAATALDAGAGGIGRRGRVMHISPGR